MGCAVGSVQATPHTVYLPQVPNNKNASNVYKSDISRQRQNDQLKNHLSQITNIINVMMSRIEKLQTQKQPKIIIKITLERIKQVFFKDNIKNLQILEKKYIIKKLFVKVVFINYQNLRILKKELLFVISVKDMGFQSENRPQIFIVHPLVDHMDILCLFVNNVWKGAILKN